MYKGQDIKCQPENAPVQVDCGEIVHSMLQVDFGLTHATILAAITS